MSLLRLPDCAHFARVRYRSGVRRSRRGRPADSAQGHRYLLQALPISRSAIRIRLIIFGEGYLNNQLRAQAASLGLGDVVQFAGFRDDLDDFMGCFDLLAHPALAEGLGVAALKAAAAGVPVVGFRGWRLVEAVATGNGLLGAAGDVSGCAERYCRLIDDPDCAANGSAGSERMRNEFSIATMADKHVALYESVLNG